MDPNNSSARLQGGCGLQGPSIAEQVQPYFGEAPPSYEESAQHRLVPSAPPAPDAPVTPSYTDITRNHAVCDFGRIPTDISTTSMPTTALERWRGQEMRVASDIQIARRRNPAPRRRTTSEPTRLCEKHMLRARAFSEGDVDRDVDLVTLNIGSKRSKKRKFLDRLVLGSWLVFWPIYLPITMLRESPADDEDFRNDVLLGEAFRIGQKISANSSQQDCTECQRIRTR